MKYVSPSVKETAFHCPHCHVLAKQFWLGVLAKPLQRPATLPWLLSKQGLDNITEQDLKGAEDPDKLIERYEKLATELPFLEHANEYERGTMHVRNVHISTCFNCNKISIWLYDRMIYPQKGEAPPANPDLPEDIRQDYEEASTILDLSPRGAAALIRLCIQKLCKHLGKSGENINQDIKALVADGLDPRVQKALDAVRVIGNHAVHPGSMDLRDDRAIAESLFRLLNLIAEKTISEPKHVDEVYASLPASQLEQIEKRDGKA